MTLNKVLLFIAVTSLLFACGSNEEVETEDSMDNADAETAEIERQNVGPVTDCDEWLSAVEFRETWEMMNATVYDERNICFKGYVLSNETYGDLIQGSVAFDPLADDAVEVPAVYCQFTGKNGSNFLNYDIGEEIEVMGRLTVIDNPNKHNFMLTKCSLPMRAKDLEANEK